MTAEEFVDQLEQSDLLPQDVVAKIRKQIGSARRPVSPKAVAKWLVGKGHLTGFQVQRLLPEEPPEKSTPTESPATDTEPAVDELGLAPIEEDEPKTPAPRKKTAVKKEPASPEAQKARPKPAASSQTSEMVEEELTPLDELGALDEAALDAGNPLMPTAPKKKGLKQLLSLPKSDEPEIKAHKEPKSRDARTRTLIVVVSGTLVSMLIVAGVIWWSLSRTSCAERLLLANESYEQENYDLAIKRYGEFLEFCPKHESASFARVRRALAGLRLKVVGTQDFEGALVAAQETIEQIKVEDEFPRAQEELASLLLDVAEGLAKAANEAAKTDPRAAQKLVVLFDTAIKLIREYIPKSLRDVQRIDKFVGLVNYVRKDIGEDAKLVETLENIDAALAQGKPDEAYKLLAALLKIYPDLEKDKRVVAKLTDIAAAEKDRVKVTPRGAKAVAEEPSSVVLSSTVLAATRAGKLGKPPGVEGRVVFALAEGAAYGLDASTGAVLWRRFVGFDTQMTPVGIETADVSDALLVDSVRNEVVRVVARSGRLRWRHPVGEPFTGEPLLLGNRILVATRFGRLIALDAQSGDALFSADLPQPLHTQPGGDPKKGYVYQVGERLNLYVMSLGDGSCRETALLGHDPGSVTVPPLVVQRYVMVVENRGENFSYLHVFATDVDGLSLKRLEKRRIEGQVNVPLLNLGERGRFMLITDRGRMYVFSTPPGNGKELRKVAEQLAAGKSSLVHYPMERKGKLWIASDRLARHDIDFSKGKFNPVAELNPGDTFTQPLAAIGEVLFHARRRKGTPGVVVSAVDLKTGGRSQAGLMVDYWQTHLAAPPAAAPHIENNRVVAATAVGDLYEIPLAAASSVAQPLAVASAPIAHAPLIDRIELGQGRAVFTAGVGGTHILRYDAKATANRASWVPLELPDGDTLSSLPAAMAGGLLAPGASGQLYLLDAATGDWRAAPLQENQIDAGQFAWRRPDAASSQSTQAVASDGHTKLYVIGIKDDPTPHLVTNATSEELGDRITSPVALIGETVYAVDAGGILHSMKLPNLDGAETTKLDAKAVWGPRRVGQHGLLSTRANELVCLADDEQRLQWRIALPGPLAGAPIAVDDHFIVCSNRTKSTGAVVSRIDAKTGEEIASVELNQPLGSGAVLHDGQLLVLTRDGTLLRTPLPSP